MTFAELLINGKYELKNANKLDSTFKRYLCRCPECKAQAFLCICPGNKENYFRSNFHKAGCEIASGGIVIKEPSGREFRFEDVFKHVDKPYIAVTAYLNSNTKCVLDLPHFNIIEESHNVPLCVTRAFPPTSTGL